MGKKSKSKGGNFERRICRNLSLIVSKGERDDLFWRSAMSGGRATIGSKEGVERSAQAGDVSAIHPDGAGFLHDFLVECKAYFRFYWHGIIYGQNPEILSIWVKLCDDSAMSGRYPLLIFKEDRKRVKLVTVPRASDVLRKHLPGVKDTGVFLNSPLFPFPMLFFEHEDI